MNHANSRPATDFFNSLLAVAERLSAYRWLSDDQYRQIADAIGPVADRLRVWIEWQIADGGALTYSRQLWRALWKAGVREINGKGNSDLSGARFGLIVWHDGAPPEALEAAFKGLDRPLWIGQETLATKLTDGKLRPNVFIWVGPRIPPDIFDRAAAEDEEMLAAAKAASNNEQ